MEQTMLILRSNATKCDHFTSSLDIRYRKVKLCGIHSMLFLVFAIWHFLMLFLRDSGRACWIISITPAEHKPDSLANVSTSFGKRILWSFRTPNVARMYSSFAASSSWNTLFGVNTRTWFKKDQYWGYYYQFNAEAISKTDIRVLIKHIASSVGKWGC